MRPASVSLTIGATILILFATHSPSAESAGSGGGGGSWELLQNNSGVSAMHMQLLNNDRVVIFDRTDFGPSNLSLPGGRCRDDPRDLALTHDCTAHSIEYDVASNSFRALTVQTDTWCSSGSVSPDGTLVQTGGFNDGERAVRTFRPCNHSDWEEDPSALSVRRWYATNCLLPDGRQIIVGGRRQFSYEFQPKAGPSAAPVLLPLLRQTHDRVENNLYPFVHLNVDGNLFIFANTLSILLNYTSNAVVRSFPPIPGAQPRNYPSSGSSVLLPLDPSASVAEVLVCGGAPKGAYEAAQAGRFSPALDSCGRIRITDESPSWVMETMPTARVMGDMVLLPTGEDVLLINGAGRGAAGWEQGTDPVLSPVVYRPNAPQGSRFEVQNPSATPRLYHSSAILLRDGRVLVGGSNPHIGYSFYGMEYPTELSLEAFSPEYLGGEGDSRRPRVEAGELRLSYGREFQLRFDADEVTADAVRVTVVRPAFSTHAYSMNQRVVVLEVRTAAWSDDGWYTAVAVAPKDGNVAPPGYYMLFVVNGGIPSEGVWVHIDQ